MISLHCVEFNTVWSDFIPRGFICTEKKKMLKHAILFHSLMTVSSLFNFDFVFT